MRTNAAGIGAAGSGTARWQRDRRRERRNLLRGLSRSLVRFPAKVLVLLKLNAIPIMLIVAERVRPGQTFDWPLRVGWAEAPQVPPFVAISWWDSLRSAHPTARKEI